MLQCKKCSNLYVEDHKLIHLQNKHSNLCANREYYYPHPACDSELHDISFGKDGDLKTYYYYSEEDKQVMLTTLKFKKRDCCIY